MPNVSQELVREAFIAPIRSALLVDDKFPIYNELAVGGKRDENGSKTAKILVDYCRSQGWLCDVDNGQGIVTATDAIKHLHQSDLLVLDLHLEAAPNDRDPNRAFRILQSLAQSPHFNLAIIYTAEGNTSWVARQLAYSLGLGKVVDDRDVLNEVNDRLLGSVAEALSPLGHVDYLRGRLAAGCAAARSLLGKKPGDVQGQIIEALSAESLEDGLSRDVLDVRKELAGNEGSSLSLPADAAHAPWVQAGNLFVAIVNKSVSDPEELIGLLVRALLDWDPSPLKVMLVHARAALERRGVLHDAEILKSGPMQAGWLLKALNGSGAERPKRIKDLYARLLEELSRSVQEDVAKFGDRVLAVPEGATAIGLAREWTSLERKYEDTHIYHALNEFLCSEVAKDGPITTGTIFKHVGPGETCYYVCVTPACDFVPGQNNGGWDGTIHPARYIKAAKLRQTTRLAEVGRKLREATHGRHAFVSDGQPIALEFTQGEARKIFREHLILDNEGVIVGGRFTGHMVLADEGQPRFEKREFRVVAQLRSDYANRFLTEAGSYDFRIGVDFFNAPPDQGQDKGD